LSDIRIVDCRLTQSIQLPEAEPKVILLTSYLEMGSGNILHVGLLDDKGHHKDLFEFIQQLGGIIYDDRNNSKFIHKI
jgi:hypothetical protein